MGQLMKLQTNWESNLKSLQVSYEDILKEVRIFRKRINAALDKLERATLQEIVEVNAVLNASLKFDVDTCARLLSEQTRLSNSLQESGNKNKELAFIACQKSEEIIKQVDKYLNNNLIQTEVSLKLIVYNDIEGYLSNLSGFWTYHTHYKGIDHTRSPDQAMIVTGETPVRIQSGIDIHGICGLFNGHILVADYNKGLKLLDLQHKVVSECAVPGIQGEICWINPCKVAVAVSSGIQFVSVNSGQLVKKRSIQLPHACTGVAHQQGNLYVTYDNALYKYTLAGTLVNKMYEEKSVYKCAVSPSGDKIYVANNSQSKLLTLASDGTVISTFTDTELQGLTAMHVTPAGHVLVCDTKTVMQVDREGKKKIATLATQKDGVEDPTSVFFSWKSGSVIVGQCTRSMLVFNLK